MTNGIAINQATTQFMWLPSTLFAEVIQIFRNIHMNSSFISNLIPKNCENRMAGSCKIRV